MTSFISTIASHFSLPEFLSQIEYSTSSEVSSEVNGPMLAIIGVVYIGILVVMIAGMWKMFVKAGQPGWASLVPFYNIVVLLQIIGKPVWWIVLLIIPFVNFVIWILVALGLAKSFGKGAGFGIGLALLSFIFIPVLGFGKAQYVGPAA